MRCFPIHFSPEEITSRSWTQASGQRIELLHHEKFEVTAPEPLEILVASYGVAGSNQTVCIDFYAGQKGREGTIYALLFHDQDPPAYNTKVTYEKQNKRSFFNVEGRDQVSGSSKRFWRQYYYCLIPRCQMTRGISEFVGPPSE
jgi:hypothetical protein